MWNDDSNPISVVFRKIGKTIIMIYQLEEILDLIHSAGHNVCGGRGQASFKRGGLFWVRWKRHKNEWFSLSFNLVKKAPIKTER